MAIACANAPEPGSEASSRSEQPLRSRRSARRRGPPDIDCLRWAAASVRELFSNIVAVEGTDWRQIPTALKNKVRDAHRVVRDPGEPGESNQVREQQLRNSTSLVLPVLIDHLREVKPMLDREYAMAGKAFAGRARAMSSIQLRGEVLMAVHDDALPAL